jgi:predicted dehydrogenase
MGKIRVGMIGTGAISKWHAKRLLETGEVEITALTDVSMENMEKLASELHFTDVKKFTDYHQMFEETMIDAVVICSPHSLHFPQASYAMSRGCHVLVEKPLTCSAKDSERLIEISKTEKVVLQVAYQRHFQPDFLYVKQAIASGEIGKLTSISSSLYENWREPKKGTWRIDPKLSGGGMLMDSGSHILDVLLWTTELTPIEVKAIIHNQDSPVEIDAFVSIQFAEGPIAGVNTIGLAPFWRETHAFCGEKGAIFLENNQVFLNRNGQHTLIGLNKEDTNNPDKSFIDAILGKHEVLVPATHALKVAKLTEMIYQAANYNNF